MGYGGNAKVDYWLTLCRQVTVGEQLKARKDRDWEEYTYYLKKGKFGEEKLFEIMTSELTNYIKSRKKR